MNFSSLKLAVCLTFLFFAKITFSYVNASPLQDADLCESIAEKDRIEFSKVYQCQNVEEEIEAHKKAKEPVICSYVLNDGQIQFYDFTNKFFSNDYRATYDDSYFAAVFVNQYGGNLLGANSATIEMEDENRDQAQITYTIYKNGWTKSKVYLKSILNCEVIRS